MHRALITAALLLASGQGQLFAQGVRPTPMVQVRVVDELGAPIDAGRAIIDSLSRWVLIEKGMATITDLPEQVWVVQLRVLGFRPESVAIRAATRPSTVPTVILRRIPQPLAAVEVKAVLTTKDSAKLRDIERRMRTANGTLLTAEDLTVRNAKRASDPLGMARGFQWKSETVVQARGGCRSLPRADSIDVRARRRKVVVVYLDGSRMPGGLELINRMVPPSDILAIETYADVISAPFIWRTNDACAVVAFWTKRAPPVSR